MDDADRVWGSGTFKFASQIDMPISTPDGETNQRDGREQPRRSAALLGPDDAAIQMAVAALAHSLDLRFTPGPMMQREKSGDDLEAIDVLIDAAEAAGIFLRETPYRSPRETLAAIRQGYSVVFLLDDGTLLVLERPDGRKVETAIIKDEMQQESIGPSRLQELIGGEAKFRMLVAKKELECESLSAAAARAENEQIEGERGNAEHVHAGPLGRMIALLDLDRRDIGLVVLFAGVSGVLGLATPLVIEGLVNVVSWGTYFQPLLVLAGMLLVCLGIAGVLKVLQTWVVEIIQRRQFVRIVSDLAHRFPRANRDDLRGVYPREFANRVFDVMTIQKATSTLLLDGVSIVLTTTLGLILLAFYHPFLLGFDIVLVLTMILFTWMLGRGGIRTAIAESKTKYAVAHWLQDVISMPSVFKTGGGEALAVMRANQLTSEYVKARKRQFRVVIRQVIFAVSLQVIASTLLLGLGGWLVIDGELTLGQLVASELVVTVVVGAFAKAGKSLEKFYDMMAGIDKVGHLLDVMPDPRIEIGSIPSGPVEVRWTDLVFNKDTVESTIPGATIPEGSRVAVVGNDLAGKSLFAKSLAGLTDPQEGMLQVGGFDAFETSLAAAGLVVGYAGASATFHGSISDNISLGRESVSQSRIREVLSSVNLIHAVLELPQGLNTLLQSDGYPLNDEQQALLMIARAVAPAPRLLVINGLLDQLSPENLSHIRDVLFGHDASWTTIVVTNREDIAEMFDSKVSVWC